MKGMIMKNKILLLSLLIAPAVIFTANQPLALQAQGVALSGKEKAQFVGRVVRWGGLGVGVYAFGALCRDSFMDIITPTGVIGAFSLASLGGFFYEKFRLPQRKRQADQTNQVAILQALLNVSEQRFVNLQTSTNTRRFRELADAHKVYIHEARAREEARNDLLAANRRNDELVRQIGELTQSLGRGFADVAQTLGAQRAENLSALAALYRSNLTGHATSIKLQLATLRALRPDTFEQLQEVIAARQTLLKNETSLKELEDLEKRLQVVADGQQFALPAPAQAAPADVLTAAGPNS